MNTKKKITTESLMNSPFYSGQLAVNVSQNSVAYQQKILVLQPKVLELLVLLCAAQGETLSKNTLTTALWPDTIVGPDSLANTVTRLRKALNDDAKNPQFIETVQRKGYRWLQKVDITKGKSTREKTTLAVIGITIAVAFFGLIFGTLLEPIIAPLEKPTKAEKFPFPDLYIERLAEGGFEVQVGIDGELTEERKVAMLKEIKRITGEEDSDMVFTIDPIEPDCKEGEHGNLGKENQDKKAIACLNKKR